MYTQRHADCPVLVIPRAFRQNFSPAKVHPRYAHRHKNAHAREIGSTNYAKYGGIVLFVSFFVRETPQRVLTILFGNRDVRGRSHIPHDTLRKLILKRTMQLQRYMWMACGIGSLNYPGAACISMCSIFYAAPVAMPQSFRNPPR